jgi:hypothetical protein
MKRIYLAFIGAVVMFSLNGCSGGSGKMSSEKYNEAVVAIHTAAAKYYQKVMTKVGDESLSQEQKQLLADSVGIKTTEWYNQLNELKYPDVAQDLHTSLVSYLAFEKDSVVPVIQKLILSADEKSYNETIEVFNKLVDRDDALNDAASKAQEEFAKKINMKLR